MKQEEPVKGYYYLHNQKIYKCITVSRGTDEIRLLELISQKLISTRWSTFVHGFERVWKVGAVAKILGRHPRSIYRYEEHAVIRKPVTYDVHGKHLVRFYTKQDILEAHEMISSMHAGRPRKDGYTTNNITEDIYTLKQKLKGL